VDDVGNILDEMPKMERIVGNEPDAIVTAYFYIVSRKSGITGSKFIKIVTILSPFLFV
jgi:hypothetical protein